MCREFFLEACGILEEVSYIFTVLSGNKSKNDPSHLQNIWRQQESEI